MKIYIFFIFLNLLLIYKINAQEKIFYETEKYPFTFIDTLSDAGGNLYAFYERNETEEKRKVTFVFQVSPVPLCGENISLFSRIRFIWFYPYEAKKVLKEWKQVF